MPILFSAVACDKVVLNKFATCDGNFSEIVEEVVTKIPDRNNKMTYSHGRFLLHYIKEERNFYFCITDRVSHFFAAKIDLQLKFKNIYHLIQNVLS